jgi:hypothetical protein
MTEIVIDEFSKSRMHLLFNSIGAEVRRKGTLAYATLMVRSGFDPMPLALAGLHRTIVANLSRQKQCDNKLFASTLRVKITS